MSVFEVGRSISRSVLTVNPPPPCVWALGPQIVALLREAAHLLGGKTSLEKGCHCWLVLNFKTCPHFSGLGDMFYKVVRSWGIVTALSIVTEPQPPCLFFHGGHSNHEPEHILKLLLVSCLVIEERGITCRLRTKKLGMRKVTQLLQGYSRSQLWVSGKTCHFLCFLLLPPSGLSTVTTLIAHTHLSPFRSLTFKIWGSSGVCFL